MIIITAAMCHMLTASGVGLSATRDLHHLILWPRHELGTTTAEAEAEAERD